MIVRQLVEGPEPDDLLAPYRDAARPPPPGRPWVMANMVCGLDGSTAVNGRVGALSSPVDRQLFVDLRSVADVVLVGAETARRERYRPVALSERRRDDRTARGRAPLPRLAIVSRSLGFDGIRAFDDDSDTGADRPIVVTSEDSPVAERERLAHSADVLVVGRDGVDVAAALAELGRRGAEVVLCEGGPALLGGLLAGGLVDELCLTLAPATGGDPLPVAVNLGSVSLTHARLAHVFESDDHLFLRYLFR